MDHEAQRRIQAVVDRSERLLWAGRPKQGLLLRKADLYLVPFSLAWCGFALFWEWTALRSGAPPLFLAFGGLFVVMGLYLVLGRFLVDLWQRRHTVYGVTNERALIQSRDRLRSLSLDGLSQISLTQRKTGEGTVVLGPEQAMGSWSPGAAWPGVPPPAPRFERIPDAKTVFDLIRKAQRET